MADVDDQLQQAITAVEAVQNLDPQQIARTETLGRTFDFSPAVPAMRRLVAFFSQIPIKHLPELPDPQRSSIKGAADQVFQLFQAAMSFDPAKVANASTERDGLINQVAGTYTTVFTNLYPIVSYLGSRERDISEVEREARAAVDAAKQQAKHLTESMELAEAETRRVLTEVRKTAAEAGVSQQARYFADQASAHDAAATQWQRYTVRTAAGLILFAVLSAAFGIYLVEPENNFEAIQLSLAKLLIFSTLAYLLFICSRTLIAHRHNEIVNKHRQNALLTFNALAEAAGSEQTREVVLTHASSCIFAPQESGFTKASTQQSDSGIAGILPRIISSQQTNQGA